MVNLSYKNFTKYSGVANQKEWITDELEDSFKKYKRIQIEETNQIYNPADKDKLLMEICEYLEKWEEQQRKEREDSKRFHKNFWGSLLLIPVSFFCIRYIDPSTHGHNISLFTLSACIYTIVIPVIYFICWRVREHRVYGLICLLSLIIGVSLSSLGFGIIRDRKRAQFSTNKEVVSPSSLSSIEDAERYIDGKTFIATPSGGVWHKVTFSSGHFTLWYGTPQSPGWNLSEEGPYVIKSSRYADTGRKFYYVTLGNKAVNYKFIINNLSFVVGDGYNVSTTRDQAEEGDWDPWN